MVKDEFIQIRLSKEEKRKWEEYLRKSSHKNMTEFVRAAVEEKAQRDILLDEIKDMKETLNLILKRILVLEEKIS